MFPNMNKQIISIVACLLGYHSYQWVDGVIIGFLLVFTSKEKPLIFNYSQYLEYSIHEKLIRFTTKGVFKYDSILVYFFIFYRSDRFYFPLQKMDSQGNPQSVIQCTSLVRNNRTEYTFSDLVD